MNDMSLPSVRNARLPATYEAARRALWITQARAEFRPGKRQPCKICGKWKGIAQAHHVFPLAEQFDDGVSVPDQTFVWLCPNHHSVVHLIMAQMRGKRVGSSNAVSSITVETYERGELSALLDLAVQRFPEKSEVAA